MWRRENILLPAGFKPWTVQPVPNRYTSYLIAAPKLTQWIYVNTNKIGLALFWAMTQRVVVTPYWSFGTTYQYYLQHHYTLHNNPEMRSSHLLPWRTTPNKVGLPAGKCACVCVCVWWIYTGRKHWALQAERSFSALTYHRSTKHEVAISHSWPRCALLDSARLGMHNSRVHGRLWINVRSPHSLSDVVGSNRWSV